MKQPNLRSRFPFFYGWVIVAVSGLVDIVSFGAGGLSFSVLMRPMGASLGWSRTTLAGAATFQSVVSLFVSPVVGPILDRYGPRAVMVIGGIVAGCSYLLISGVSEPWQFYLLYTAATALGLHEMGSLVTSTVVSKWFVRKRGRALAITALGNNIGGMLLAPATAFLIASVGWRSTWAVLGMVIMIVALPPILLFMRGTPESMGLAPDGDATTSDSVAHGRLRRGSAEPRWTIREAFGTPTLWLLVLSINLSMLNYSGLHLHLPAHFVDAGLTLEGASAAVALSNFAAMGSKLFWGFLAERIPVRYCLMGNYLGRAIGVQFLLMGSGTERVFAFAIVAGLFGTSFVNLQAQIWADYYGRTFLGSIRGFMAPFTLISSLVGNLLIAFLYDQLGSYETPFLLANVALTAAIFVTFFARPPGRSPAERAEAAAGAEANR